ncbi:MAG: DUF4392 domain-containing protein [Planctomycetes bacterium]|nr:DUF4392 domain-containing protein [Planctomycetota bacterium]
MDQSTDMKSKLKNILLAVQQDIGKRGLAKLEDNLISRTKGDFEAACASLAKGTGTVIFTGFYIPTATPPAPETDGPPGALLIARTLASLGRKVAITCEKNCMSAFEAGLQNLGLSDKIQLIESPLDSHADYAQSFFSKLKQKIGDISHFIAIEKCGPSHLLQSIPGQNISAFLNATDDSSRGKILTMSGKDITPFTAPVHHCFDPNFCIANNITRIGIGDGGNEIGMGNIPWHVIAANINNGSKIACATTVDHLIVAGVSNWGGYALGSGLLLNVGLPALSSLDPETEWKILEIMVQQGGLVDGRLGERIASVDGIDWSIHTNVIGSIVKSLEETA